jgi:hypothetical protein
MAGTAPADTTRYSQKKKKIKNLCCKEKIPTNNDSNIV